MPKHRQRKGRLSPHFPVNPAEGSVDETFIAAVRDLLSDGRGVVRAPDGRAVFVPGVWCGEKVRVQIVRSRGKVFEGRLLELLEPSHARRNPPCQYHGFEHGQCGGCAWQFVDYQAQLEAKKARVQALLRSLSSPSLTLEMLTFGQPLGYRNRAQLKTDGALAGFLSAGSHTIADIDCCPVLSKGCEERLADVRSQLPNASWRPQGGARWTTLDISEHESQVGVNRRHVFRQGNTAGNEAMRQWLARQLQFVPTSRRVLELFSGDGNFTEVLAALGFSVDAVEVDAASVARLRARNLARVQAWGCNLSRLDRAAELASTHDNTALLLLDPPRSGFASRAAMLPQMTALQDIIYISCNPATWVRDAQFFESHRFVLNEVALADMFPQTPHCELLSRFHRPCA